jgi:hypothetical protein
MQHLYRKIFREVAELDEQIDKFRQLRDSYVIANSSVNSRYSAGKAARDSAPAQTSG